MQVPVGRCLGPGATAAHVRIYGSYCISLSLSIYTYTYTHIYLKTFINIYPPAAPWWHGVVPFVAFILLPQTTYLRSFWGALGVILAPFGSILVALGSPP